MKDSLSLYGALNIPDSHLVYCLKIEELGANKAMVILQEDLVNANQVHRSLTKTLVFDSLLNVLDTNTLLPNERWSRTLDYYRYKYTLYYCGVVEDDSAGYRISYIMQLDTLHQLLNYITVPHDSFLIMSYVGHLHLMILNDKGDIISTTKEGVYLTEPLSVFSNPYADYLKLRGLPWQDFKAFYYKVYDVNGRLLKHREVEENNRIKLSEEDYLRTVILEVYNTEGYLQQIPILKKQ